MRFSLKNLSGFTLIEVAIVIAIIGIISIVGIFSYRDYMDNVELNGSAERVILALRQAQVWGSATREFPTGSGHFDSAYGVYFDSSVPNQLIFFADAPTASDLNDGKYNGTSSVCDSVNGCIEKIILKSGYNINFCAVDGCATPPGIIGKLNITFERSQLGDSHSGLESIIMLDDVSKTYARISIHSNRTGKNKFITVGRFGNIEIE